MVKTIINLDLLHDDRDFENRELTKIVIMTSIREELDHKLNNLSSEQLDSIRQFVESLEHQTPPVDPDYPLTNENIDRIGF
jgi:mRNA-degrading endonuclease RelE of RelBE toxin-antitoxin system